MLKNLNFSEGRPFLIGREGFTMEIPMQIRGKHYNYVNPLALPPSQVFLIGTPGVVYHSCGVFDVKVSFLESLDTLNRFLG